MVSYVDSNLCYSIGSCKFSSSSFPDVCPHDLFKVTYKITSTLTENYYIDFFGVEGSKLEFPEDQCHSLVQKCHLLVQESLSSSIPVLSVYTITVTVCYGCRLVDRHY